MADLIIIRKKHTTNIDITTIKRYENEHNIWFIGHKISISDNIAHGYETSQWHKIRVSAWLETPQDKQHFWIDIHVQTAQQSFYHTRHHRDTAEQAVP